jgi:hypothetical protein
MIMGLGSRPTHQDTGDLLADTLLSRLFGYGAPQRPFRFDAPTPAAGAGMSGLGDAPVLETFLIETEGYPIQMLGASVYPLNVYPGGIWQVIMSGTWMQGLAVTMTQTDPNGNVTSINAGSFLANDVFTYIGDFDQGAPLGTWTQQWYIAGQLAQTVTFNMVAANASSITALPGGAAPPTEVDPLTGTLDPVVLTNTGAIVSTTTGQTLSQQGVTPVVTPVTQIGASQPIGATTTQVSAPAGTSQSLTDQLTSELQNTVAIGSYNVPVWGLAAVGVGLFLFMGGGKR